MRYKIARRSQIELKALSYIAYKFTINNNKINKGFPQGFPCGKPLFWLML